MKRLYFLFLLLVLIWPASVFAQNSTPTGSSIIQQMHDRYDDNWYSFITFKQKTSTYKNGRFDHAQTWYEALSMPGKLAIKFDSLSSGSGYLFREDSLYVFQNNKLVKGQPFVHALLVLGFDVYAQPPAVTIEKLRRQGFDLSKSYQTQWQGRPVYVVGAANKDEKASQFWIDKKRLYFVRMLNYNAQKGTMQETQFNNYQKAGGGWVAAEVLFYDDGILRTKEAYTNIAVPEHLKASVFDTNNFEAATW